MGAVAEDSPEGGVAWELKGWWLGLYGVGRRQ